MAKTSEALVYELVPTTNPEIQKLDKVLVAS